MRSREGPLLEYVVFTLHDGKENRIPLLKRRLILQTLGILVVIALISFNKPFIEEFLVSKNTFWIDSHIHSILETFCGLIFFTISFILLWEYLNSGKKRVLFLLLAFFSMALLDFFHAFSDYCHVLFVWFHSFSAFFGAVFFFLSLLLDREDNNDIKVMKSVWTRRVYVLSGVVLILFFAILSLKFYFLLPDVLSVKFSHHTPVTKTKGHFSNFIYILNFSSCVFYLISGIIFVRGFLKSSDIIYLIFGTSTLLLFESELSFIFSKLWDPMWWYWHVIKVFIASGLLIGLAYGFTRTFYGLHSSKIRLSRLLEEIEEKNIALKSAYDKLKKTQIYLKESEKLASIGKMAAMLAHELRNPLGAINNSISVLKRYTYLNKEDRELLEIVEDEIYRLNKLVEDFLSFSKPSRMNKKKTDLHRLINETLLLLNFDNKIERKISIEKFFDYDTPPLMLDKNSIKQVLLNIINNSIEAMPEGGVLTINTRYKESEKEVELVIGDTGIGISEETLSQVFQPFFTTKDKGLGLGLNIVQKFVKEHGGYITITSTPGMGTQVTLVFPVDIDKVPEAKKEEVSSHSSI